MALILMETGAFGTISKGLVSGLKELEIGKRAETIQTTASLRSARILRKSPGDLRVKDHQLIVV